MELKPLQDLKASELDKVPDPINARFWIGGARDGYGHIRGLREIWEQCIQEVDPRRDHWNHKNLGFERLLNYLERGSLVLVFDLWPLHPINRAYVEQDGQWQTTRSIFDSQVRRRFDHHAGILQEQRREREAHETWYSPQSKLEVEPVTGPGARTTTLGPHVDGEAFQKLDEKTASSGQGPKSAKQTTPESQKTVDGAIQSIKGSTFASSEEGKKVVIKIEELNTSGKIKFESMNPSMRGKWSGSEIVVNTNSSGDIDATASELVHEATHALHEDELPASKTKITIDEEMRTNENQLALYEDQRKAGFRDPELEQRRNDQANGKLRENVRRRYPGTPEQL